MAGAIFFMVFFMVVIGIVWIMIYYSEKKHPS